MLDVGDPVGEVGELRLDSSPLGRGGIALGLLGEEQEVLELVDGDGVAGLGPVLGGRPADGGRDVAEDVEEPGS